LTSSRSSNMPTLEAGVAAFAESTERARLVSV